MPEIDRLVKRLPYFLVLGLLLGFVMTCSLNEAAAQNGPASAVIQVDFATVLGQSPTYYGVENTWIDQDRELYIDRYRRLHGNVVRAQITQAIFEPVNDDDDPQNWSGDFSALTIPIDSQRGKTFTYGDMFTTLQSEFPDMHFQINVWLAARWNASNENGYLGFGGAFPPIDSAEHSEFIRELARWLVEECGIAPERLSFTFVNEPNLTPFFVGTVDDLVRMAESTRAALDEISPAIRMGGLDEVHGTSWSDQFAQKVSAGCCDMWTFHVYESGLDAMWQALDQRIRNLSNYGPVWVTEFADLENGSPDSLMDFSTRQAALEFAVLLGRLWSSNIEGVIHFRMSDTYSDQFNGWAGHGLFADARGSKSNGNAYEPYPVFWVFANMYTQLGGGAIVQTMAPDILDVVAVRRDDADGAHFAIWVTNTSEQDISVTFAMESLPEGTLRGEIFNNLVGDTPFATQRFDGDEFEMTIPGRSSYTYVFTTS